VGCPHATVASYAICCGVVMHTGGSAAVEGRTLMLCCCMLFYPSVWGCVPGCG
jgi:hypothetical protein